MCRLEAIASRSAEHPFGMMIWSELAGNCKKDGNSESVRNIMHREIQGLREHNDKQVVVVKPCELGGTPNVIYQPRAIPNQVLISREIGKA